MREFKGPKYQQGKLGYEQEETEPDSEILAKRLARKSKVTSITVDNNEVVYIYCNLGKQSYGVKYLEKLSKNIKESFETALGVKVVVGYYDLQFTQITKKQAFEEKLKGNVSD